jgi:hypothetical protein
MYYFIMPGRHETQGAPIICLEIAMTANATAAASFYKTVETLHGTKLFTYTASVLHVLGLIGPERGTPPVFSKRALCRFYGSDAVVRHHTAKGNLERFSGGYRLTTQGRAKFMGRVVGNGGQSVDRELLPQYIKAVKTGETAPGLGKMFPVKD